MPVGACGVKFLQSKELHEGVPTKGPPIPFNAPHVNAPLIFGPRASASTTEDGGLNKDSDVRTVQTGLVEGSSVIKQTDSATPAKT